MPDKKRVLIGYMNNGCAGGVDKYLLNLIESLDLRKYEIDLLVKDTESYICCELKEKGIGVFQTPSLKTPLKQYKALAQLMKRRRYDVAYFNISTAIHCIGLVAAKKCGVCKRIVHSHSSGFDIENSVKRTLAACLHNICKYILCYNANCYIGCSEKAGVWLFTEKARRSKRYYIVHNSVDLSKFAFNAEMREHIRALHKWENKIVVTHVANFSYVKNSEFLIDVFNKVCQVSNKYILIMIGTGIKETLLKDKVKKYGLEDKVKFMGTVSNVNDYLQGTDIFVLPSKFEGYPLSALEAQVSGAICLLSDQITRESKIIDECYFVPLVQRKWVEKILQQNELGCRSLPVKMDNFDNGQLCKAIEKIWGD